MIVISIFSAHLLLVLSGKAVAQNFYTLSAILKNLSPFNQLDSKAKILQKVMEKIYIDKILQIFLFQWTTVP